MAHAPAAGPTASAHAGSRVLRIPGDRPPVRLVVRDETLRRSRLTVFLRLLLALPHFVWLALWGIAASIVSFVLWLAVLINGEAPSSLHDFVAGYVRYATHFSAYLFLAADPYPGFRGAPGYPVDVEIDPPARQSRWTALGRFLLSAPAIMLASSLGAGFTWSPVGGLYILFIALASSSGVTGTAALLAWFASLVLGRTPRGIRDVTAYALGYGAQTGAYALLLTGRHPSSDPALARSYAELPDHPVKIAVADDLGRSRLTVLFRLLLAVPHFAWLLLWTVPAFLASIAAWLAALVTGRVPAALHRFLAAYVRYATHVFAFSYLVGRRFPGFTGREGSYGIDVEIAPPERQSRWKTLFRFFLAIPALMLGGALGGVVLVVAFLGWWYAIVTGRFPEGFRNLGASCFRYSAQSYAYLFLLTSRYPYASPVLEPPAAFGQGEQVPPGAIVAAARVVSTPPAATPEDDERRTDVLPIVIVCALVLVSAVLGVLGIRALIPPEQAVLRVLAPPSGCWSIASGRDEHELLATHAGCGVREISFDASGFEALLSTDPPTTEYTLGATILVDGEVVRHVTPAVRGGLIVRYGDDLPEKHLVVRIEATREGCWTAVVDDTPEEGCGSRTLDLGTRSTVAFNVERESRGSWPLFVAVEADGQVVQTIGPDRGEYPRISGGYSVPRPPE